MGLPSHSSGREVEWCIVGVGHGVLVGVGPAPFSVSRGDLVSWGLRQVGWDSAAESYCGRLTWC